MVMADVVRLKHTLNRIVEPDFGLLDKLLLFEVLTPSELADVRGERTVFRQNKALLKLITYEDQCCKLLTALQQTGQQHVANLITYNGGETYVDGIKLTFAFA